MGVTESKTSPRHLNFLKQLKKTTEMMPLMRVLFLDTPGHPTSAPQYSNSCKYTIYAHNNLKFGHSLWPPFFIPARRGRGILVAPRFCPASRFLAGAKSTCQVFLKFKHDISSNMGMCKCF